MNKILILFSFLSWINFVVSQTPTSVLCNMKTDENIDDCIKEQLPRFLETENANCSDVRFTLTNNNITKLPEAITDACNNPNTGICCSYIKVKDNTNLTLNGKFNVRILNLYNTPIDISENKPLLNTTKMIYLVLSNCSIHELYNETFSMLPNLTLLFLYNNALRKLPENLFKVNKNLETVHLENNNLSMVPGELFTNNKLLQKVYLQNNTLKTMPAGLFENNTDLQEVYLQNNKIISLPNELFMKNTNLMTVNLTNNNLTEIVVYYNKNLTVHILNQINISELCKGINSTEVKINFTDSENPNCTMYERLEHTSTTTTTTTINTTQKSNEEEHTELKKYAWLYFFSIILFQLIILAILIVLYIRDKDDVSQKID